MKAMSLIREAMEFEICSTTSVLSLARSQIRWVPTTYSSVKPTLNDKTPSHNFSKFLYSFPTFFYYWNLFVNSHLHSNTLNTFDKAHLFLHFLNTTTVLNSSNTRPVSRFKQLRCSVVPDKKLDWPSFCDCFPYSNIILFSIYLGIACVFTVKRRTPFQK